MKTREEIKAHLESIVALLDCGCGDNSCSAPNKPTGGQATNGGCRCYPSRVADELWSVLSDIEEHGKYRWKRPASNLANY